MFQTGFGTLIICIFVLIHLDCYVAKLICHQDSPLTFSISENGKKVKLYLNGITIDNTNHTADERKLGAFEVRMHYNKDDKGVVCFTHRETMVHEKETFNCKRKGLVGRYVKVWSLKNPPELTPLCNVKPVGGYAKAVMCPTVRYCPVTPNYGDIADGTSAEQCAQRCQDDGQCQYVRHVDSDCYFSTEMCQHKVKLSKNAGVAFEKIYSDGKCPRRRNGSRSNRPEG